MPDEQWDFERLKAELENLTPGGEKYHNNPQACIQFLQEFHRRILTQQIRLIRQIKGKINGNSRTR